MTQGSVGARLQALARDPARFYADDDAGRAQLIAYCNERVEAFRALMPQISKLGLKVPLQIKRVPADIEAGAALGYMNSASLDGSRPAIYYINLKSTKLWAKHELSSLTAHEACSATPSALHGRTPERTAADYFADRLQRLRRRLGPVFGTAGRRIRSVPERSFRPDRLPARPVVPRRAAGGRYRHALQWTRQQAIRFAVENTGRGVQAMTSEMDRYAVSPGQACGYKMGHNEILRQRERAKAALGSKFDLAAFNDALVSSCGVPLTVLPTVVDRYIARA
jgi:uncharacterized protein (DUF885 family)